MSIDNYEIEMGTLANEIEKELAAIGQMTVKEKKMKNEDIKSMINYVNSQTDAIEARRNNIADKTWQGLGLMVTAFGIIIALSIPMLVKLPILIILFSRIIFSLLQLGEYQVQSEFRYPFLKLDQYSNRWKWFYYGNKHIRQVKKSPFFYKDQNRINTDNLLYAKGLRDFIFNYRTETVDQEIKDNIYQLFLLQFHNMYKNQFYLRLLKYNAVSFWSVVILIIAYIIILALVLLYDPAFREVLLSTPTFIPIN